MLEYPADGIKKSAITAVGLMCVCVHKTNTEAPSPESHAGKLMNSWMCGMVFNSSEPKLG